MVRSIGFRALLLVLAVAAGAHTQAFAQTMTSVYTRHNYEKCGGRGSEEGVELRICVGAAKIPVLWSADDNSSRVGFGPRRGADDSAIAIFYQVQPTIEWRGPPGGKPIVAIVRYVTGSSVGKLDSSMLVLTRIMPDGYACLMATVTGAKANERARAIVDEKGAGHVCGTSEVIKE